MLDVDPHGLDVMDRKLLEAVIHRFDGGPVGLDNVAAAIGEERDTIEDVIEPLPDPAGLPAAHAARPGRDAGGVPPPRRRAAEERRRRCSPTPERRRRAGSDQVFVQRGGRSGRPTCASKRFAISVTLAVCASSGA